MFDFNINNVNNNQEIVDVFLINSYEEKMASNNKQYYDLILENKNGLIKCKQWGITDKDKEFYLNNKIVMIKATVNEFKGDKQLIINNYKPHACELKELIKCSEYNVDMMINEIITTINNMRSYTYRMMCNELIVNNIEAIKIQGASKQHHHNFVNGYLEHNYTMLISAKKLSEIYYKNINPDLLFAGVVLHDIGKLIELRMSLQGKIIEYTYDGELLGHINIGLQQIIKTQFELENKGEILNKKEITLLSHLIASHHGEPNFGSCKYPMIKEAELLHNIDMLDTKMNMFDNLCETIKPDEFTSRQWGLNNRKITKTS